MDNERRFYTYAYLREDRTPYYIGKGTGKRAYSTNRTVPPPPRERILLLKTNLTEEEAFRHEIYMIAVFGRRDNGTGILRNFTEGGEGTVGIKITEETRKKLRERPKQVFSEETREKIRQKALGRKHSKETREKLRQSHLGYQPTLEHREKLRQAALRQWERKRLEEE